MGSVPLLEPISLNLKEIGLKQKLAEGQPEITDELRVKLDFYFSLPEKSGLRSQYSQNNQDLVAYFDKNREFKNKQRIELGLAPIPAFSRTAFSNRRQFNRYASLTRKKNLISVKSIIKAPRVKKYAIKKNRIKLPIYKVAKAPKLALPKYDLTANLPVDLKRILRGVKYAS